MSFQLPSVTRSSQERPAWSGMAVVVESMLLLLFLIGSLAILLQLFATGTSRASEGERLAQAVAAATSAAERFAADPADSGGTTEQDELQVVCDVTEEDAGAGTLYHATITVFSEEQEPPVYVLETARYVRGEVG